LGSIFLWAFLDKLFGWGLATPVGKAWLDGVSPTAGFLKMGTHGPFASIFQAMSGWVIVDILFMIGLLCIGLALILGVAMKLAGYSGALLVFLMWLALLPPEHHPLVDEHIIYLFVLLILTNSKYGEVWGMGKWWSKMKCVKKHPILK
jgi:thiosulfate dehydrogenase [quinone] large subunit